MPVFECRRAAGAINIDGKADEPAWQQAQLIDNFGQPWLKDGPRPPKTATKARLLWDRDNLYFFADLEDHDLFADLTEHDDRTWLNDVFEMFFRPDDSKPPYYEFQINAAGTMLDIYLSAERRCIRSGQKRRRIPLESGRRSPRHARQPHRPRRRLVGRRANSVGRFCPHRRPPCRGRHLAICSLPLRLHAQREAGDLDLRAARRSRAFICWKITPGSSSSG